MPSVLKQDRKALFVLAALLIIVAAVQSQNMFRFPYYHDAEGTYMANSVSIAKEGQLSPYTYSYEDPPVGSLLLAGWTLLTGGVFAFGFPINSGRVLMLVLHLLSTGLVFIIAKKISKSTLAAVLATLLFAFSPLATSLQRVVLVQNIGLVWLLSAFYLAVGEQRTLMHYFASSFFFALAVLTDGSTVFFLPALLYIIYLSSHPHHRRFATIMWVAIALTVISFYPLYAQMKEELFPEHTTLGGDFPHVSLLERLNDRGPDTGRFLNYGSGLGDAFHDWVKLSNPTADPVLIYMGLVSAIFILLMSFDNRALRPLIAMLVAEGALLLFGGPVYNVDVILLLPFLALCVGILAAKVVEALNTGGEISLLKSALMLGVVAVVLYPFWSFNATRLDAYTEDQVTGQLEATKWVNANLPADAVVVTDNYAFVELRQTHPNVHNYWRVDTDPAVKFRVLRDDLCSIDYVITTPQIFSDIQTFNLDLMRKTIDNSKVLMTYQNNGWPVEVRQVDKTNCAPRVADDNLTVAN